MLWHRGQFCRACSPMLGELRPAQSIPDLLTLYLPFDLAPVTYRFQNEIQKFRVANRLGVVASFVAEGRHVSQVNKFQHEPTVTNNGTARVKCSVGF